MCLMVTLDFKNIGCFGSGRKFGHFFAETETRQTETEISVGHYYQVYFKCCALIE